MGKKKRRIEQKATINGRALEREKHYAVEADRVLV
jgi:hypothetical protein